MPISNEEYNSGRTKETLESQILTFLTQNNQKAYTMSEISYYFGYRGEIRDIGGFISGMASYFEIQNVIKLLLKEGKITAREIKQQIGQETYYKAVESQNKPKGTGFVIG